MKNRLSAFILAVITLISLYPPSVLASAFLSPDDFTLGESGEGLVITGYTGTAAVVDIPETINGKSVVGIGINAFENSSAVTQINIPGSVKNIGADAFYGCTELTSITVAESNPNYSDIDGVLYNNDKTALIRYPQGKSGNPFIMPDSVTVIEENALSDCTALKSVKLSKALPEISSDTFNGCTSLTSITVAEGNPTYSDIDGVLYKKYEDKNILFRYPQGKSDAYFSVPSGVTDIGSSSFYGAAALKNVTIPESVTVIDNFAFQYCAGLTDFTVPNTVTVIGECTFGGCNNLRLTIPYHLLSGLELVYLCLTYENIVGVSVSADINSIKAGFFKDFPSLESITVDEGNQAFSDVGGVLYSKDKTALICYPPKKSGSLFYVPAQVTTISSGAFIGCKNITQIRIGDNVKSIQDNAFSGVPPITVYCYRESSAYTFLEKLNDSNISFKTAEYIKNGVTGSVDKNGNPIVTMADALVIFKSIIETEPKAFFCSKAAEKENGEPLNLADVLEILISLSSK